MCIHQETKQSEQVHSDVVTIGVGIMSHNDHEFRRSKSDRQSLQFTFAPIFHASNIGNVNPLDAVLDDDPMGAENEHGGRVA